MRRRILIATVLAVLAAPAQARAQDCDDVPVVTVPPVTAKPQSDPLVKHQWALEQIHAVAAWDRGFTGRGALIAILDTGVDLAHPDLAGALVPGGGGGGASCPARAQDDHGHGTHVAGIAAAVGGNGIGVAGVAPAASILPIKVGIGENVDFDAVVRGIRTAADRGADVVNLSLSTGESVPVVMNAATEPKLEAAVEYAWSKGTVVVAAAGNDTGPLCKYPAGTRYALCVTASDVDGRPPSYSNAGMDPDGTKSVRAPGGGGTPGLVDLCTDNVLATIWSPGDLGSCRHGSDYGTSAGTSMATPHVTGLAALLAAGGLGAPEIVERIRDTVSGPFGIIDAGAATEGLPVPAPAPPAAPPPAPGGSGSGGSSPAPSAAERRCAQARATLALRTKELRAAQRKARRARSRAAKRRATRLVARRRTARTRAVRDARRRC